jgi:DNA-binding cell septation regulator SpoVG
MTQRKKANGEFMDIVAPINAETRKMLEEKVFEAYQACGRTGKDESEGRTVIHPVNSKALSRNPLLKADMVAFSGPIRPVIPVDSGHSIRSNPATHSGAFRPPPERD